MSRKFRWIFEGTFPPGKIEPHICRVSQRPNYDGGSWEIKELKDPNDPDGFRKMLPKDGKWQEVVTTFYDYTPEQSQTLFEVLQYYYQFDPNTKSSKEITPDMLGEVKLKLMCPRIRYIQPEKALAESQYKAPPPPMGIGALGRMGIASLGNGVIDGWDDLEEWELNKACPKSITFGDLDFSSSEVCTIEVTWVYNEVYYKSHMPKFN